MNKFSAQFKIKVAIEAIRGEQTSTEIAKIYDVHPYQVIKWCKQFLESANEVFSQEQDENQSQPTQLTDEPTQLTKLTQLTDEQLFGMHLEGDKEAFGLIYNRYKEYLKGKAFRQIPDKYEAEDIAQESLVALSFTKTFDGTIGSVKQYLCAIANNKIKGWFRKNANLEVFDIREEQLHLEKLVTIEELSNSTSYRSRNSFWNNLRSQKQLSIYNQLIAYLTGQAKNRQFEYFRKGGHDDYLNSFLNCRPELADPEQILIKEFLIHELEEALTKLPKLYKEVLTMLIEEDSSYLELATKLGMTSGQFKAIVYRARKLMRQHFGYTMENVQKIGKWRISN